MSRDEIALRKATIEIPQYLKKTYWWAYLHPRGVRFFERHWVVNLILFGNYRRLVRRVLKQLSRFPGSTLQVACVYGELSIRISELQRKAGHRFDVLDVAPIQLSNLRRKLGESHSVGLHLLDSTRTGLPDGSYTNSLLFFLLHEQPADERSKTLAEAIRVTRPGGKVIIVDYARPHWWSPMRYLLPLFLKRLEPFAMDLWSNSISDWLPQSTRIAQIDSERIFAGLYQKTVITLAPD